MNEAVRPSAFDRRRLGRALSRAANAGIDDILAMASMEGSGAARRIGVTGPPGSGKSTLIAALARHRLQQSGRVAIIAIDPTSPRTQGSVLGDRIRMDSLVGDERVFIRSLASRGASDGLTENLPEILAVLDAHDFDEIIIETVGVGQSEFAVRDLVDIELLVMTPGAGDQIQAMKAGIIETADIFVINKSDQPGAGRVAAELRAVLALTSASGCVPPIVRVRADTGENIAGLDAAITTLMEAWADGHSRQMVRRQRARHRVRGLLLRRLAETLDALPQEAYDTPIATLYAAALSALAKRRT